MRGQSHMTREDQSVLGIVKFFTCRSRRADEVLLLCPCQCWASTNARQLQTPTLPSPWRAGGACLTGSGPQRRKSQCPVMLCPSNSLVRSKTQNVLSQQECVFLWMSVWEVFSCLFVFSRCQRCICDWHCPLQKPCFYSTLPEVAWLAFREIYLSQDGAAC